MIRPTMKDTFAAILTTLESRSTCRRLKVAALLVKDDRIISMGWNGTIMGHTHCTEHFDIHNEEDFLKEHHDWSMKNELHAELNAIAFAAKQGISTNGSDLFVSISPCVNCANLIIAAGVSRVYYKKMYDRSTDGLEKIKAAGIITGKL